MSDKPEQAARAEPFWKQLSLDDVVVFLFVESIATPINIAAGDAFVNGTGREWFGWGVGLPLGLLGITFHWWKRLLSHTARQWFVEQVNRWAILTFVISAAIVFAYVAAPNIYRRASSLAPVTAAPSVFVSPTPNTAHAPAPTPAAAPPVKAYSEAEKEDLRNAMRALFKILDEQGADVTRKINDALQAWDQLSNGAQISNIPVLLERLDTLAISISMLSEYIRGKDGPLKQYNSYSQEISPIINLPPEWNLNDGPIYGLVVGIIRFKEQIEIVGLAAKHNDQPLLQSTIQNAYHLGLEKFQPTHANFSDWIKQTKQRIDDFRQSNL